MKPLLSRRATTERRRKTKGPASRSIFTRLGRNRFGLPSQKEGGSYSKLFSQRRHFAGTALASGVLGEQIKKLLNIREEDTVHLSMPAFSDPTWNMPERKDLVIISAYDSRVRKGNNITGSRYFPVLKSKNPELFDAIVDFVRKRQ